MAEKHLWEYDHPYYCSEGNYFASSDKGCHSTYESWAEFADDNPLLFDGDLDLNRLHRWDWHAQHLEDPEEYPSPHHQLQLFFVLQRKANLNSVDITVTEADEPAIREWLTIRAEHERKTWAPLLDNGGV